MASEIRVFISSKMVELLAERQVLHELLPTLGGDLVRLRAWVFEDDAPAANRPIREVYLDALKHSDLYLGLFWNDYGDWTIDEFHHATKWSIDRHIYVKNVDTGQISFGTNVLYDDGSHGDRIARDSIYTLIEKAERFEKSKRVVYTGWVLDADGRGSNTVTLAVEYE